MMKRMTFYKQSSFLRLQQKWQEVKKVRVKGSSTLWTLWMKLLLNFACSSSTSEQPRQDCFTTVVFHPFTFKTLYHPNSTYNRIPQKLSKTDIQSNKKKKQTDYFYFYLESMFRNSSKTNTFANPHMNSQSSEPCPTSASQQSHASKLRAKSKIIQAEMFSELQWTSSIPSIKH